jgi:hypothetical protein
MAAATSLTYQQQQHKHHQLVHNNDNNRRCLRNITKHQMEKTTNSMKTLSQHFTTITPATDTFVIRCVCVLINYL